MKKKNTFDVTPAVAYKHHDVNDKLTAEYQQFLEERYGSTLPPTTLRAKIALYPDFSKVNSGTVIATEEGYRLLPESGLSRGLKYFGRGVIVAGAAALGLVALEMVPRIVNSIANLKLSQVVSALTNPANIAPTLFLGTIGLGIGTIGVSMVKEKIDDVREISSCAKLIQERNLARSQGRGFGMNVPAQTNEQSHAPKKDVPDFPTIPVRGDNRPAKGPKTQEHTPRRTPRPPAPPTR